MPMWLRLDHSLGIDFIKIAELIINARFGEHCGNTIFYGVCGFKILVNIKVDMKFGDWS